MEKGTTHWIVQGDSITILKKLPSNSLHLCITSPPYFNARKYSKWETFESYMSDMKIVFTEIFRILDNHRVCVINVGDIIGLTGSQKYTNRKMALGAHFTIMMESIGFEFVDDFIWDKGEAKESCMDIISRFHFI